MNNKGQAFIESMILLSIVTVACIFLIRLGLHLQNEILLDDLVEETLICKLQKKEDCLNRLAGKLYHLNFVAVQIDDFSRADKAHIRLQAHSSLDTKVVLERELSLALHVD